MATLQVREEANADFKGGCEPARPFLKWVGGKSQLLLEIKNKMPKNYGTYFEPFVGGGAVFFRERPKKAVLIDINAELINAYIVVRDHLDDLIEELQKHRYDKEYFYKIRNVDRLRSYQKWSSIQRAARLIFLNKSCFNGLYRVNSKGHFNVPFGRYTNPTLVDYENLHACNKALQGVELFVSPFFVVEDLVEAGDFVYFDPPYAPLNETSHFTNYSMNGFSKIDQQQLRDLVLKLDKKGVHIMVSNSDVPFIRELYEKRFKVHTVYAARAVNSKGNRRGKITELLITNDS